MNDILTEAEVAALLDCEPSTAQAMAREGKVPAIKAGRSWRFPKQALIEALNDQARQNMTREAPTPRAVKVKPVRPCLVGL
jgi:excisionase family DNA binding protein